MSNKNTWKHGTELQRQPTTIAIWEWLRPIAMEWMPSEVFVCVTIRCAGVITMSPFFGRCWGLVWTSLGKCSNGFNLCDTIQCETTCNLRPTYVQNRCIAG